MIEIQEITYRYPGAREETLRGVSLPVAEGSALGLLGPNGAGKTTLMSLLAGLLPVQGGQILFDGVPLQKLPAKERQRVSLVPQDFAFYPLLSVWDNMRFFAALYAVRDEGYLKNLLAQTGLSEHRAKLAKHLSGGLKRRLNFAIGLINRPKLIFLDEITVGIDPESRRFILDSVAGLTRQGITVVYTSHYLQEIELLCRDIALLHGGRLVYHGGLHDILRQGAESGLSLRTEPPLPDGELAALQGRRAADGTLHFDTAAPAELLAALHARGYTAQACRFGFASLESFYLDFLAKQAT
ncbi:ABC transporter ATP-binding protein [Eikenella sp. Marseille-P7795]|uniref:ABC transporter ATP-binding protein n=1 Tax=Eikenella sp. Marseille-P7795 TaxID=2866577 RepID=UPI001CE4707D|nr:ABC transporter ATP-binding protein [Eikenella sp. Marseille-P7795]